MQREGFKKNWNTKEFPSVSDSKWGEWNNRFVLLYEHTTFLDIFLRLPNYQNYSLSLWDRGHFKYFVDYRSLSKVKVN